MLKTRALSYLLLAPSLLLLSPRSVEAWVDSNFTEGQRVLTQSGRFLASDVSADFDRTPPTPEQKAKAPYALRIWQRDLEVARWNLTRVLSDDSKTFWTAFRETAEREFRMWSWRNQYGQSVDGSTTGGTATSGTATSGTTTDTSTTPGGIVVPSVFGGIDPTGDVLMKLMRYFEGKLAEQDAIRKVAQDANDQDRVKTATTEIENFKKQIVAISKIQKWLVDPSGVQVTATQKIFLDRTGKRSSEIQLAEAELKKLTDAGQGRSEAALALWRKIKFYAEELKENLLLAIDDFAQESSRDEGSILGGTTSIGGGVSGPTSAPGVTVPGAGSGVVVPGRTTSVAISGPESVSVDVPVLPSSGGASVSLQFEPMSEDSGDDTPEVRPRVKDDILNLNRAGLGKDLLGCVDQFGWDKAYPCSIRKSQTDCKRTTCSNQQMEAEFERLRTYFVTHKEKEMASCGKSHFLKKAKVYGMTREQVAKKIKALKARIGRASRTGQAAKVLSLQAELRKYQFRYHSKDYFESKPCKTIARDLQCKLAAIWSVQDRLSYRKRKPELVKRDLFGKLPPAQQNACFSQVIQGKGVGVSVVPAADPAEASVQAPSDRKIPGLQDPVVDEADL